MSLRAAIVALIVLATAGFVVGTTIERNSNQPATESPAQRASESPPEGGGRPAEHVGESPAHVAHEASHGEVRPFGVDIEAPVFVILAALASLALAGAVWIWPRSLLVLAGVGLVMVLFAVLDIREISHQLDEHRTGLVALAGAVAALHLSAAAAIGLIARTDRRTSRRVGTMPA
jgi:hypothetical protein